MAVVIAARAAQVVKELEFTFNIVDTMINTSGVSDGFATVAAHVFDVAPMPINSVVVGGSLVTDTAVTGSTAYNVTVGDAGSAARYLGTTDKTTAASTALVPTGFRTAVTTGIRLTVTPTVATSTAGKLTLRVLYVTDGQADYTL
jgi:hypothetical protein